MKKIVIGTAFLLASMTFAQTSKEKKINEFIHLTAVDKLGKQSVDKMVDLYKQHFVDLPEEFWEEFKKEVNEDELTKMYIPIYDKYYSESDLDALIKFYKSPTGKKMVAVMPEVMNESMERGRIWGEGISRKVIAKIEKAESEKRVQRKAELENAPVMTVSE